MGRPLAALPPAGYIASQLLRGAVLWLLVRLLLLSVFAFANASGLPTDDGGALTPAVLTSLMITGVVALLAWIDTRVMREQLFFANLGISPLQAPLLAGAAAFTLDLVVRVFT